MKNIWLCLLLLGCSNPGSKDCLVKAVGFSDAYKAANSLQNRWARVLIVYWIGERTGHSVAIYEASHGLMCYDSVKGSWLLTRDKSLKDNPVALAELWAPNTYSIREAFWFE